MPFDLTTMARVKARLAKATGVTTDDSEIRALVTSVSAKVEKYLDRHVLSTSRTEDYDVRRGGTRLMLKGFPVTTLTSIKNDVSRDFSGDAIATTAYHADMARGVVVFDKQVLTWGPGVLRVAYTGGLGASLLRMTGVIGTVTGSMTANNVVSGGTSGARGTIVSISSGTSISVDVDSGVFVAGETLTDVTASGTCTLSSISQTPIIMAYPDIVNAVEEELRMRFLRRDDLHVASVSADGVSNQFVEEGQSGLYVRTERALRDHKRMEGW